MNNNEKALDIIAQEMIRLIERYIPYLPFDQTFKGNIQEKDGNTYKISIKSMIYTVNSINNDTYNVGDVVYVTVPCNNWKNSFIQGKVVK